MQKANLSSSLSDEASGLRVEDKPQNENLKCKIKKFNNFEF